MGTKDPRIDAYMEKSAPFAKPILKKLRSLVHKGCPEVVETVKWGMPSFEYKGIFCGMAAFKQHCVFGFWKSALLFNDEGNGQRAMGNGKSKVQRPESKTHNPIAHPPLPIASKLSWGAPGRDPVPARITSVDDLPSDDVMLALIKRAAKLNDDGVKLPRVSKKKKPLAMPKDFAAEIKKSKRAATNFDEFSPSHQREYIEWIVEAKTDETRQRRMATAIEWIAQGKARNWKYQRT
jgi:uncharacterized protein YdeI (YjbR/CyaY-like superfamily)